MVDVAQLVRALVCGTRGREFESHLPPHIKESRLTFFFLFQTNVSSKHIKFYNQILLKKLQFFLEQKVSKCKKLNFKIKKSSKEDF